MPARKELLMLVQECMTKNVELTDPNATIRAAAEKMRDGDFGMLPIGENDRLVGTITDRDITIRAVAEGLDPESAKVRDVMSSRVLYCFEDQDAKDVARNMGMNQVRRLPVLNREKRLVGIVSLGDLTVAPDTVGEALKDISRKDQGQPLANIA
jgi:CBS domain-containing protein